LLLLCVAAAHLLALQSGPKASLYLTLVGILAGFLSTFWNLGYQRTAARMQEYLDGANVAKVKKQQVFGADPPELWII
jgi:hypothetical protein